MKKYWICLWYTGYSLEVKPRQEDGKNWREMTWGDASEAWANDEGLHVTWEEVKSPDFGCNLILCVFVCLSRKEQFQVYGNVFNIWIVNEKTDKNV